jgi:anti-sigma regulatory factor (Ser/Thr protein kinase)
MGAPPQLAQGTRWRRVFPGEERELGRMRRWLASLLPACPAREDLVLVADELCTNTIQHTASGHGGSFAVEITWLAPAVRVAVADNGGPGEPQVIDNPSAEDGRGLLLVHNLSERTGVRGDHRGRTVWADVRWDGTGPVAVAGTNEAIVADEAALARQFAGTPAWFGRYTREWWAMTASDGLVSAPSARELAASLHRLALARAERSAAARPDRPISAEQRTRRQQEPRPSPRADPGNQPRRQRHRADRERPDGYSHATPRTSSGTGRVLARQRAAMLFPAPSAGGGMSILGSGCGRRAGARDG